MKSNLVIQKSHTKILVFCVRWYPQSQSLLSLTSCLLSPKSSSFLSLFPLTKFRGAYADMLDLFPLSFQHPSLYTPFVLMISGWHLVLEETQILGLHRSDGAHSQIKSEIWLEFQDLRFRFPDRIWDLAGEPDHKRISKYWSFV